MLTPEMTQDEVKCKCQSKIMNLPSKVDWGIHEHGWEQFMLIFINF
jgi:hypothetical protein